MFASRSCEIIHKCESSRLPLTGTVRCFIGLLCASSRIKSKLPKRACSAPFAERCRRWTRSSDHHEPRNSGGEPESDANFRETRAWTHLRADRSRVGMQRNARAKSAPGSDDWFGPGPRQFEPCGGF